MRRRATLRSDMDRNTRPSPYSRGAAQSRCGRSDSFEKCSRPYEQARPSPDPALPASTGASHAQGNKPPVPRPQDCRRQAQKRSARIARGTFGHKNITGASTFRDLEMHGDAIAIHQFAPAFVKAPRERRLRFEHLLEAKGFVGFDNLLILFQFFFDIAPAIRKSPRIQQNDAVADNAEIFQMRIHRKEPVPPSVLPGFEIAVEPAL